MIWIFHYEAFHPRSQGGCGSIKERSTVFFFFFFCVSFERFNPRWPSLGLDDARSFGQSRIACAVRYARGQRHNKRARHAVVLERRAIRSRRSLEAFWGRQHGQARKFLPSASSCVLLAFVLQEAGGESISICSQTIRLTHLWIPKRKRKEETRNGTGPYHTRFPRIRRDAFPPYPFTKAGQFHDEFQKQMLMC